jgi:hypothetical protein
MNVFDVFGYARTHICSPVGLHPSFTVQVFGEISCDRMDGRHRKPVALMMVFDALLSFGCGRSAEPQAPYRCTRDQQKEDGCK